MSLIDAKWINSNTLAVNDEYTGTDVPGTGDNILQEGQMRLWYDTTNSLAKLVGFIGGVYYTSQFLDGAVDGGDF